MTSNQIFQNLIPSPTAVFSEDSACLFSAPIASLPHVKEPVI